MKPTVSRTFTTKASPEAAFAYLADFSNAEEWDPGTKTCTRVSGDGGVGTVYHNVSSFLGREVEVDYTAVEVEEPTRIHMHGKNEQFDGHDVLGVRAHPDGAEISYTAQFGFSGVARFAAPLVAAYLPHLATKTIDQLRECLDRLPRTAP
ncbi:SRPBCC family protein [Nocardioides piscis]|uniref:Polyketide cyclase n=1 Tax=Nocardioides piscis TaxID=2714938 RepID=A0A6G7YE96_9ACTN|nr:SRPBCC family protein [Nocardioides piscis]QIK74961.1 polyketide cyclase [Nocardioides piscis]